MKRALAAVGLVAIALIAIWVLRCDDSTPTTVAPVVAPARSTTARVDPSTLVRGSIAGTVTSREGTAIARARVCAMAGTTELDPALFREPSCVETDARGRYQLLQLLPAVYTLAAGAPRFRPATHMPVTRLRSGEHVSGIDIQLGGSAVELTGVVMDITGGPIAGARVMASPGRHVMSVLSAPTATDANGAFTLWSAPGAVVVRASAEGYAANEVTAHAPGSTEVLLTPESVLAGTVVDEAGAVVADARVTVLEADRYQAPRAWVMTAADGTFRAGGLTPGRYTAMAQSEHGYGRIDASVKLGLGETREGVIVTVRPAHQVSGVVRVAETRQACDEAWAEIRDVTIGHRVIGVAGSDGVMRFAGVFPGTYSIDLYCTDHRELDRYAPIVVSDRDVSDLVWEVSQGSGVHGRVLDATGQPVEDAFITSVSDVPINGMPELRTTTSRAGGAYELRGISPGPLVIEVSTDRGVAPHERFHVDVPASGEVTRDLVLEGVGAIVGTVVDADGRPVQGVLMHATPATGNDEYYSFDEIRTDARGAFHLKGLPPGEYQVTARRSIVETLRAPGASVLDREGVPATVTTNGTTTVKLVVEAERETIAGVVMDTAGRPVGDAYVMSFRETAYGGTEMRRWSRWFDTRPVVTTTAGTFALASLAPGRYSVRAYRKGGDEILVEHVAAGTQDLLLQLTETGSITGRVRSPGPLPDRLTIRVTDSVAGIEREEQFFRTQGAFAVDDLPPGHYDVLARVPGAEARADLDLAVGERKTGVVLSLSPLVTIAGRVIDHATKQPVPGVQISIETQGQRRSVFDSVSVLTYADGRFALANVTPGLLTITGSREGHDGGAADALTVSRQVEGSGRIDVGDLELLRSKDETSGESGIRFQPQPPDTFDFVVMSVMPGSAADQAGIVAGDILTSVDGIELRGNVMAISPLVSSPAGTVVRVGLARDVTVSLRLQ